MAGQSDKTKEVKLRMPNKEFYLVESYAAEHGMNRSQAIVALVRKGLEREGETSATSADIALLRHDLEASFAAVAEAIKSQPIAVQEAAPPPALPDPDAWKSKSLLDRIMKR